MEAYVVILLILVALFVTAIVKTLNADLEDGSSKFFYSDHTEEKVSQLLLNESHSYNSGRVMKVIPKDILDRNPNASWLALDKEWHLDEVTDDGACSYNHSHTGVGLTVSLMEYSEMPVGLEKFSKKVAQIRVNAQFKVANDNDFTVDISEPDILQTEFGYNVSYVGKDSRGLNFMYAGIITSKFWASFYLESEKMPYEFLPPEMNDILRTILL